MTIVDSFFYNGHVYATCVGENITSDFACTTITVGGRTYKVTQTESRESFTGNIQAMLEIVGETLVPLGACTAR